MSDALRDLVEEIASLSGRLEEVVLQGEEMARVVGATEVPGPERDHGGASLADLEHALQSLQSVASDSHEQIDAELTEVKDAFAELVRRLAEGRGQLAHAVESARDHLQAFHEHVEEQRVDAEESVTSSGTAVTQLCEAVLSGQDHVAHAFGQARDGANDLHHHTEAHRSSLATAVGSLHGTAHGATEGVEHAVEALVQALAHHGHEHAAQLHAVQEALGRDGHEMQIAITRLIEAVMKPLLDEAIAAIRQVFADFIAKMGKGHGELALLRSQIEPLFHQLGELTGELGHAAAGVQRAADESGHG